MLKLCFYYGQVLIFTFLHEYASLAGHDKKQRSALEVCKDPFHRAFAQIHNPRQNFLRAVVSAISCAGMLVSISFFNAFAKLACKPYNRRDNDYLKS